MTFSRIHIVSTDWILNIIFEILLHSLLSLTLFSASSRIDSVFVVYTSLGIPSNTTERSGFPLFFLFKTYFIFHYVYKVVYEECVHVIAGAYRIQRNMIPLELGLWLWAAHSGFWELNLVPTQEQSTVFNHWATSLQLHGFSKNIIF